MSRHTNFSIKHGLRVALTPFVLVIMTACGGGGGDAGGGGGPPATYSINGFATSLVAGDAVAGVSMSLSGASSATTATDGTGHYSFTGLSNGNYNVTATRTDTLMIPDARGVTISGASVAAVNFVAVSGEVITTGIEFLPQFFSSAEQLRADLGVIGSDMYFTDSSDFPLKKQPLDGSPAVPLAMRFASADGVVLRAGNTYWVGSGNLYRTTQDGVTTLLVAGQGGPGQDTTAEIVADDQFVYWVNTIPTPTCSPPCTWVIQRVPASGGAPATLATVDRLVVSLAADADNLYWEEEASEPVAPNCQCGSKIQTVPKAGGQSAVLVDGMLNGTLPEPPPGHIPGTWRPTGGIAVTDTEVAFAVSIDQAYQLRAVSKQGGSIRDIADVTTSTSVARNAIVDLDANDADLFWIDTGNASVATVPLTGGTPDVMAAAVANPGGLAVSTSDIYWTEKGDAGGCCLRLGQGSIRRVSLAGGSAVTVAAGLDAPGDIAVSTTDMAWAESWRIAEMPTAGGTASTLVSGIASNMARIAVTQSGVFILDGSLVKIAPLQGGVIEKFVSVQFGSIGDASFGGGDIVADENSVYWTVQGAGSSASVQKVALSGGVPELLAPGDASNPQDCYRRVAVDPVNVYWSTGSIEHPVGCAIYKVPTTGGAATRLVDVPYMVDFTIDEESIYFSEFADLSIQRITTDGGAPALVATDVAAWVLGNDNDRIYWLDLDPNNLGVSMISKVPGTVPSDVLDLELFMEWDPFLAFEALYVDASGIYFTETTTGSVYLIF